MSADPLTTYLDCLFGAEPAGSLLEVRWRLRDRPGMGQHWRLVEDRANVPELIRSIGAQTDLYVGCAPRTRREGRRDAIERVHVLWADCDSPESIAALERFPPAPSMVIGSGSGRHAYWSLWPPGEAAEVERANRRLAHALGADMAATDAPRILRPPDTFNFKTGDPVPVEVEHLALEVYTLEQVVPDLADPPVPERPAQRAVGLPCGDDPLLTIPPPVYVELLTGREVGRDGKVSCPLHEDRTPSLHAYSDPEKGWYCFGCEAGGSIIDLGARLFGLDPRSAGYHAIGRRLAAELLGREAA